MKDLNKISEKRLDEMLVNYCNRSVPYSFRVKDKEKVKRNNLKFKPRLKYAAVAVCIILSFTAGLFSNRLESLFGGKNCFTIIANAASSSPDELTPSTVIKIQKFDMNIASVNKNHIQVSLDFDVKCVGENIKTIRYISNYSSFGIYSGCEAVIEKNGRENPSFTTVFGQYNSYLVNYDNQPRRIKNSAYPIQLNMKVTVDDDIELLYNYYNYTQYLCGLDTDKDFDVKKLDTDGMFEKLYSELFDKVSVDVLVNYEDGTTEKRKIQIGFDRSLSKKNYLSPVITAQVEPD